MYMFLWTLYIALLLIDLLLFEAHDFIRNVVIDLSSRS